MRALLAVSVLVVLVLGFALSVDLSPRTPAPSFHLEFSKTGGIAGVDNLLTIDKNGAASYTSKYGTAFKTSVLGVVLAELEGSITSGLPQIHQENFQASPGAADYFTYRLSVGMANSTREVVWVDDWAAKGGLPAVLKNLQNELDRTLEILTAQATFANMNSSHASITCDIGANETSCGSLGLTIYTDQLSYQLGEQVQVFALLTNIGSKTVYYISPTPCDPDIRLTVSGDSGIQDISRPDLPPAPCVQVLQQRSLGPNRTLIFSGTWNMSLDQNGVQIQVQPGGYTVSARMPYAEFDRQLVAVSVTITVHK